MSVSVSNIDRECPCGSGKKYLMCCGIYIESETPAPSPETLMRSRYTAYHDVNLDYIAATMQPPASEGFDAASSREWAKTAKWVKLEVLNSSENNEHGTVEFIAHYLQNNKPRFIRELSEFRKENGCWYYVDGKHFSTG